MNIQQKRALYIVNRVGFNAALILFLIASAVAALALLAGIFFDVVGLR